MTGQGAQLKEKKRQRLMKNMEDGRARVRQQKLEVKPPGGCLSCALNSWGLT